MATRTISIADDAYRHLKRLKRPDESFSDVIRRLTGHRDLTRHSGTISSGLAADLRAASQDVRRRMEREHRERLG